MTKPVQITLCTPEEIRPVASFRMPALDCWLVVAFWISGGDGDGWWKVFPEHWLTHEAAEGAALKLHQRYIQRHLMRVVIRPGGGA